MRLVAQFVDPGDAAEAGARLRAEGIPIEVACVDPHVMTPSKTGATRVGLWVVADGRLEDARRVLQISTQEPEPGYLAVQAKRLSIFETAKSPALKIVCRVLISVILLLVAVVFLVNGFSPL